MPMTKYEGQTLVGKTFQIEECWFVNCVLRDCTLFFGGGTTEWINTRFENCQWKFQNEAARTCQFLMQIGLLPPPQQQIQPAIHATGPIN